MKYNKMSDKEFVVAWMKNKGSVHDLARDLGTTSASLSTRASVLRKRGVKLPFSIIGKKYYSADALNKIVEKYS